MTSFYKVADLLNSHLCLPYSNLIVCPFLKLRLSCCQNLMPQWFIVLLSSYSFVVQKGHCFRVDCRILPRWLEIVHRASLNTTRRISAHLKHCKERNIKLHQLDSALESFVPFAWTDASQHDLFLFFCCSKIWKLLTWSQRHWHKDFPGKTLL